MISRMPHLTALVIASAACSAPTAQAGLVDVSGVSGVFDKVLTIQPIRVCSALATCGDTSALFKTFATQTYAQYGIALAFLPTTTIYDDIRAFGTGASDYKVAGLGQSSNVKTINAWVQPRIFLDDGRQPWGNAYVDGNIIAINSKLVLATGPNGRQDSFAHEIGHALGLDHATDGDLYNLLRIGADRKSPTMVLDDTQKATIRTSQFVSEAPKLTLTHEITNGGATVQFSLLVESLPEGVGLRRFSLDLPDLNMVDPKPEYAEHGLRPWEYLLDLRTSLGDIAPSEDADSRGSNGVWHEGALLDGPHLRSPNCSDVSFVEAVFTVCYGENSQVYFPSGYGFSPPEPDYLTTDGLPEIVFDFGAPGASQLMVGDRLNFSINMLEHHLSEETLGTSPFIRALTGTLVDFEYDFGLSGRVLLDADGSTDSRQLVALFDSVDDPAAFGQQFAPGEVMDIPADAELETGEEPVAGQRVPTPPIMPLVGLGLALVAFQRRTSARQAGFEVRCDVTAQN